MARIRKLRRSLSQSTYESTIRRSGCCDGHSLVGRHRGAEGIGSKAWDQQVVSPHAVGETRA